MRITVVTPSFNQGAYLEETICSVLDQGYPDLEFMVVDGGSTDNTREILERYSSQLAWWVSEKDRGQTHAINKGLARATGEVWSYLNSDDLLAPGALQRIAECFADPAVQWVGAVSTTFDANGERGRIVPEAPERLRDYLTPWSRKVGYIFPCSNVCFMRRALLDRFGTFDESYHYSMDMELYTRIALAGVPMLRIPDVLGRWRWHDTSKTVVDGCAYRFLEEEIRIAETFLHQLSPTEQAEVAAELVEMRKHLSVRRALGSPSPNRSQRLALLFGDVPKLPSLFWFRPWLGAVRQVLFSNNL